MAAAQPDDYPVPLLCIVALEASDPDAQEDFTQKSLGFLRVACISMLLTYILNECVRRV
jgi:hypothetical protein